MSRSWRSGSWWGWTVSPKETNFTETVSTLLNLSAGIASFKLINEMRRKAVIDENGFMVAGEDQKISSEVSQVEAQEEPPTGPRKRDTSPQKRVRSTSPRKGISGPERRKSPEKTSLRKESIRARAGDPKHNWRILSDTVGFTVEEDKALVMKDSQEVREEEEALGIFN